VARLPRNGVSGRPSRECRRGPSVGRFVQDEQLGLFTTPAPSQTLCACHRIFADARCASCVSFTTQRLVYWSAIRAQQSPGYLKISRPSGAGRATGLDSAPPSRIGTAVGGEWDATDGLRRARTISSIASYRSGLARAVRPKNRKLRLPAPTDSNINGELRPKRSRSP